MSKNYIEGYTPQKHYALIGQKALVLNSKNQILFLKRSEKSGRGGGWDICGGGLEKFEDPVKGIEREIEEESGLKVKDIKPIATISYRENNDWTFMVGYQATAVTADIELSWEHDEYVWKSIEETENMDLPDFFKTMIKALYPIL